MIFKFLDHQARWSVLYIQPTQHPGFIMSVFPGMLKKRHRTEVKTMTAGDVEIHGFQVVFWKMNAVLIHARLRKDFALSPKAINWCLSGKRLWRNNHFPWGCIFPSGVGMGWWSFRSRWAFCLTAIHRWLTSWLLIMEGCWVLIPGWSAGWKLLMHSQ